MLPLTIHGVLDVLDNFFVTRCFFANFANFSSGSELCFCKLSCYLQIDIMDNFFWNFLFHNYFFANLATSSSGLKLCKFFNSASIQFFFLQIDALDNFFGQRRSIRHFFFFKFCKFLCQIPSMVNCHRRQCFANVFFQIFLLREGFK